MRLLFEIDKKDYDPDGEVFRRPSSRGIIFRGGRIAVIYSRRDRYCKLPGGGIEPGEDNVSAMIREVREETGLAVKPETVREFGYVHRIQKGTHEPVFIQDNYYYFCEVGDVQKSTELTQDETAADFVPMFMDIKDVIGINEACLCRENNVMIERELRVLKMIAEELSG
ncbi:MAG: NUDIX domain-containing protein [Ruminiclostridium sp.]|nr:NUDIX domain-containing protein [Ruminiclostridium sp.]